MNNDKPILAIVLSESCGACTYFKSNVLNDLVEKARKHVDIFKIETHDRTLLPGADRPDSLVSLISWFPNFVLVTRKSWIEGIKSGKPVIASVYNAIVENGLAHRVSKNAPSSENLIKWIETEIANNPSFKSGVVTIDSNQTQPNIKIKGIEESDYCGDINYRGKYT